MNRSMKMPVTRGYRTLVGDLLLIVAMGVVMFVLLLAYLTPKADSLDSRPGKAVMLHSAVPDYPAEARNPLIYIQHLGGAAQRWHYAELADGSQWVVTRCPQEDSDNCWWNAHKRGNGIGHSFVTIHGVIHYLRTASQP